jgi:hypothetical protein
MTFEVSPDDSETWSVGVVPDEQFDLLASSSNHRDDDDDDDGDDDDDLYAS